MAKETHLDPLFLGEDHSYIFTVKNGAESACLDITTYAMSWMLKRRLTDADSAKLLEKTTASGITIAGLFNASPSVNLQVATVAIADTDTDAFVAGLCYWELKRTDAGLEAPLAYGTLELKRGVHRS